MIPSTRVVLDAYPWLARRWKLTAEPSAVAISAALADAHARATLPVDEPAALFYAFATHRRAMPGAWRPLAIVLTSNQVHALGLDLRADADELDALARRIMLAQVDWRDVREWFASRVGRQRDDG